jgi:hypothetical protein
VYERRSEEEGGGEREILAHQDHVAVRRFSSSKNSLFKSSFSLFLFSINRR